MIEVDRLLCGDLILTIPLRRLQMCIFASTFWLRPILILWFGILSKHGKTVPLRVRRCGEEVTSLLRQPSRPFG